MIEFKNVIPVAFFVILASKSGGIYRKLSYIRWKFCLNLIVSTMNDVYAILCVLMERIRAQHALACELQSWGHAE